MHTLLDFLTHVKGVEYIISVLFIVAFILYLEVLKPRPFRTLLHETREDLDFMKASGLRNALKTAGSIIAAPFIGLFYVVCLPFIFCYAVGIEVLNMAIGGLESLLNAAGKNVSFGWRPQEAYFAGRKRGKKRPVEEEAEEEDDAKRENQ